MFCNNRRVKRRGAAVVEFVAVAPLVFLLLLGMIEFGRAVLVQQILTKASRVGARRAATESASSAEVESIVRDYLQEKSISGATVAIDPRDLRHVGSGDPVTVSVSVQYQQVNWLPSAQDFGGVLLRGASTMRVDRRH